MGANRKKEDWKPEFYITEQIEENELVNTDLEPWEPGMRGVAVDLSDGRRMEVFFTVPLADKEAGRQVRVMPAVEDVCEAVVTLFGAISGKGKGVEK